MIEWFTVNWQWYGIAFATIVIEVAYALYLMNLPSPEKRSQGYSLLFESIESLGYGILLLGAIAGIEAAALVNINILPPGTAEVYWSLTVNRIINYTLSIALLERDLTLTVIFSPLAGTVSSAAMLGRFMAQFLLYFSVAMLFLTKFVKNYGSLLVSIGIAMTSVKRLRSIGPYLVFSVLAIAAISGGTVHYVLDSVYQLKFNYTSGIIDVFSEAFKQAFTNRLIDLVNDGKLLSEVATVVAVASAIVIALAAAASRAAGGFADTFVSRVRGL
jgi:hypothetical protein